MLSVRAVVGAVRWLGPRGGWAARWLGVGFGELSEAQNSLVARVIATLSGVKSPQVPKYQAIYSRLRQQILDGDFKPGDKLPPQQEMAESFGVTLMTLRQAIAALETDGLVWASRGRGTYVSDNPVDISLGNLSSFAQQMRAAGVQMSTRLVSVTVVTADQNPSAAASLETADDLICIIRLRSSDNEPFSLQRSYVARSIGVVEADQELPSDSLYESIEAVTGWTVASARESITAVGIDPEDAKLLRAEPSHPALLSVRTSINQFERPFLYDEALLVGGRCTIAADRTSDRLSLQYGVARGSQT